MSEAEDRLKDLIKQNKKLEAIKFLRENDKMGLAEAKERVEQLRELMIEAGEIDASLGGKSGCSAVILLGLVGAGSLLCMAL